MKNTDHIVLKNSLNNRREHFEDNSGSWVFSAMLNKHNEDIFKYA